MIILNTYFAQYLHITFKFKLVSSGAGQSNLFSAEKHQQHETKPINTCSIYLRTKGVESWEYELGVKSKTRKWEQKREFEVNKTNYGEGKTKMNNKVPPEIFSDFPIAQMIKNLPAKAGDTGSNPGSGRPSEKEMATYCTILAWRIPWTEEPRGLQSMGSKGVGQDSFRVTKL